MFEIPFATPQGSAVAQFKVSRDGAKGGKGQQAPVWRANFSLDVEPMGPVHAQIILAGERSWVSLWAERDESVARLRGQEAQLTKALKDLISLRKLPSMPERHVKPRPAMASFWTIDHDR